MSHYMRQRKRKPSQRSRRTVQRSANKGTQHPTAQQPIAEMSSEHIRELQRTIGNAAVQRMLADTRSVQGNVIQRTPQVMDFSDEPLEVTGRVVEVGPGSNAADEIDTQIGDLVNHIQDFWTDYDEAVNMFSNYMTEEHSTQAVEAQYLDVAIKEVGKYILEAAVGELKDKAGKAIPVLGHAVGATTSVVKGVWGEYERSKKASEVVLIRDYIANLKGKVGEDRDAMVKHYKALRLPLKKEYAAISQSEQQAGGAGGDVSEAGVIVGEGASYLAALREGVQGFKEQLKNRGEILQEIAERFALQGKDGIVSLYSDYVLGNYLHIEARAYKDGDKWKIEEVTDHWTLVTSMPRPGQLADALTKAMALQNQSPIDSNIPKMVHLTVEEEVSWLNDYYDATFVFQEDASSYELRAAKSPYEAQITTAAWDEGGVRDQVTGVTKLHGSSGDA